ncbi:MAG: hypothetical protein V4801_28085, partial [Burkholderia gladioli]
MSGCANFGGDRVQLVLAPRRDRDLRAERGQVARRFLADAGAAARNQDYLAFDVVAHGITSRIQLVIVIGGGPGTGGGGV